jgi:phage shock protein E
VLLLAALALGCASSSPPPTVQPAVAGSSQRVTLDQVLALQAQGARLVDVRTPEEFASGHMAGAVNIPFDALDGRAAAELAPVDAPVVVYCHSGKRSARAAATLKALGFGQVHDLGAMPEDAAHK